MTVLSKSPLDALQPEAMIAGTLCLMSCYVQHPIALYAQRVASNLAELAGASALSPELRTICRRLAERWEAIGHDAQRRAERGETARDGRAVH